MSEEPRAWVALGGARLLSPVGLPRARLRSGHLGKDVKGRGCWHADIGRTGLPPRAQPEHRPGAQGGGRRLSRGPEGGGARRGSLVARSSSGSSHEGARRVSSRLTVGLAHPESHAILTSASAFSEKCRVVVCVRHGDPLRVSGGATPSPFMTCSLQTRTPVGRRGAAARENCLFGKLSFFDRPETRCLQIPRFSLEWHSDGKRGRGAWEMSSEMDRETEIGGRTETEGNGGAQVAEGRGRGSGAMTPLAEVVSRVPSGRLGAGVGGLTRGRGCGEKGGSPRRPAGPDPQGQGPRVLPPGLTRQPRAPPSGCGQFPEGCKSPPPRCPGAHLRTQGRGALGVSPSDHR